MTTEADAGGIRSASYDSLPSGARGVWRIETKHGTAVFFDLDEGLFHRIPGVHPDGTVSASPWDGEWVRCGLGPYGPTSDEAVEVGHSAMYGIGFSDYVTTSRVTDIRPASAQDVPPPNAPQWTADSWRTNRTTAWCSWDLPDVVVGEGGSQEEALMDLARQIDTWLGDITTQRWPGRTARGWLARRDSSGSVGAWVEQHAEERRPRW